MGGAMVAAAVSTGLFAAASEGEAGRLDSQPPPPKEPPPGWTPEAWDIPPDRLSVDPQSEHHNSVALARGITITFNNVVYEGTIAEYCVAEGWIRKLSRDARGRVSRYPDGRIRLGQPLRGAVTAVYKRPA
jgi:hypothetical protein